MNHRPLVLLLIVAALTGCATRDPTRSFRNDSRKAPDKAAVVRNFPRVVSRSEFPEAAPVEAVLRFWTRRRVALEPADSLSDEALVARAWSLGLWVHPFYGTPNDLKRWLRAGIPVLAHARGFWSDAAVVIGFSDLREAFLCDDGPLGPREIAYGEFLKRWRAGGERAVAIAPPRLLPLEPGPSEFAHRGRFFEARGNYEAAAQDYERAIGLGMHDALAFVSLGNVYRALNRRADAESAYRRALAKDDTLARAANNLAYLLAEENRELDEAEQLARRALARDPGNPFYMDTLGFVFLVRDRPCEAADVLERAWGRSRWQPTAVQWEIGCRLAIAHRRCGMEHLAKEVVRELRSLDPKSELPPELRDLAPSAR